MVNGVTASLSHADGQARPLARDALDVVLMAEAAAVQVLDVDARVREGGASERPPRQGGHDGFNAFGERVIMESTMDPIGRVRRAAGHAAAGERVALVASSSELLIASAVMRDMASQRLAIVAHAMEPRGAEDALALADLGWGLLVASDVEESLDLTLVARRAAEDCGTPFLVVHDQNAIRRVEPLPPLDPGLVAAFVGSAENRMRRSSDPAHPSHAQVGARAFAERVPFALASALRELESLTGRKRDLVTRSDAGAGADASLMLVGLGALGDVLLGEVPRLRALGHDVGAVKFTAFRPFPGPRAVRLLARSLAITVLEHTDFPLAQSNYLARELKAGFSDALTWAPEYPGIGRIPRVHTGVARRSPHELETHDLDAIVQNMLAGEHGKRVFVLGGGLGTGDLDLAPAQEHARRRVQPATFHMRGVTRDAVVAATAAELTSAVIATLLSLKVRALIRPLDESEGGGCAFDLVAAPSKPLGVHLSSALALVVLDDAGALIRGNPVARLAFGGTLAVPSRKSLPEAVWADVPPYVKAVVFDREARVIGWDPVGLAPSTDSTEGTSSESVAGDVGRWLLAASFAGVALAVLAQPTHGEQPQIDASLLERDVTAAVHILTTADAPIAARAGRVARKAFEAHIDVPRGIVEQDQDAIRLGRQDARAASTT